MDQGTNTHRAGLQSDVERGTGEAVGPKACASIAQCEDLRVGTRIIPPDRCIGALAHDRCLPDEHGANRDLARLGSLMRQTEGPFHPHRVVHSHPIVEMITQARQFTERI